MDKHAKVYIAGHTGLVGRALTRRLDAEGYTRVLRRPRAELDLCDQAATLAFFEAERPDYVVLAAARVGGIHANASYPAEFIYTNLAIQVNVLTAAHHCGVKRLLFFGSSCAYPKNAAQPMREEDLFTGPLEPTSAPYAVAKLAGIEMCAAYNRQFGTRFLSVIPATVYGPGERVDPMDAHVLPALLARFRKAKRGLDGGVPGNEQVIVWGTGSAQREFLFVEDLADASILLMRLGEAEFEALLQGPHGVLNMGGNEEVTIRDLAALIKEIAGYQGRMVFDTTRPDGAPRKQLDATRIARLGWRPKTSLAEGVRRTDRKSVV